MLSWPWKTQIFNLKEVTSCDLTCIITLICKSRQWYWSITQIMGKNAKNKNWDSTLRWKGLSIWNHNSKMVRFYNNNNLDIAWESRVGLVEILLIMSIDNIIDVIGFVRFFPLPKKIIELCRIINQTEWPDLNYKIVLFYNFNPDINNYTHCPKGYFPLGFKLKPKV